MHEAELNAAQALADVAAIAILVLHRANGEAQVANGALSHALDSRIVIEQAKGMVAERARPSPVDRRRTTALPP